MAGWTIHHEWRCMNPIWDRDFPASHVRELRGVKHVAVFAMVNNYPSCHNHGGGKWVYLQYSILVSFHLGWFSTCMMMGERVVGAIDDSFWTVHQVPFHVITKNHDSWLFDLLDLHPQKSLDYFSCESHHVYIAIPLSYVWVSARSLAVFMTRIFKHAWQQFRQGPFLRLVVGWDPCHLFPNPRTFHSRTFFRGYGWFAPIFCRGLKATPW